MPDRRLAAAYAQAAYEAAVDPWIAGFTAFREALSRDKAAEEAVSDGSVPFEKRQPVVDGKLPAGVPPELRNLVYALVSEGHLAALDDVISELRQLARSVPGAVVAEVTSAIELDDSMRSQLRQRLAARYGSGVDIEWRVNPSIIGGVVVRVGDELIDGSLATRLETLRQALQGGA